MIEETQKYVRKYRAKADANDAIAQLIAGALENGEFKDLTEDAQREVGRIMRAMDRAVERNQAKADNPPKPKPHKTTKRERKPKSTHQEVKASWDFPDVEVKKPTSRRNRK